MIKLKNKETREAIASVQVSTITRFPGSDPTAEQEKDKDFVQTGPSVVLLLQTLDADGKVIGSPRSMDCAESRCSCAD